MKEVKSLELELDKFKELYGKCLKRIAELHGVINKLEEENEVLKAKTNVGRKAFDDEATILMMFDMYCDGYSFSNIAAYLNERNIKTKKGGTWAKSSVSLILKKNIDLLDEEMQIVFKSNLNKKNKKDIVQLV
ncbi:MAG: recombinase family protein [Sarcina sp.]